MTPSDLDRDVRPFQGLTGPKGGRYDHSTKQSLPNSPEFFHDQR